MLNHQTPVQKQYKEDCRQESVICQVQVCKIGKYIFSTCWRIAGFAAYWEGEEMVRYRIEFLTICRRIRMNCDAILTIKVCILGVPKKRPFVFDGP